MRKLLPNITFLLIIFLFQATAFAQTVSVAPTPSGQVVNLKFSINGIGANGNTEPLRKVRSVDLLFYSPDINPEDPSSSPLATFTTTAEFTGDVGSGDFGFFVNQKIDLGDNIPAGEYQVVVDTERALPKLIKTDEESIGGMLFEIGSGRSEAVVLIVENMLPGDIYPVPAGNGVMDIDDYNLLAGCFSLQESGISCPDSDTADLDDNGVLDGVDYNLMFASFARLSQLGFPVPSFDSVSPTVVIPTQKPTDEPAKSPSTNEKDDADAQSQARGGLITGIVASLFFIILLVVMILKRRRLKSFFDAMLHKDGKRQKSVKSEGEESSSDSEFQEEKVDKDYFVKKQAYDEIKKVTVLTLTDDTGPMLGYYPKNEEINDGFFTVKGSLKKDGDKIFVDVSEIKPAESS